MIMRLVLPRYEKVHFLSGICSLFLRKEDEVHYIGGAEILPPPLEGEREAYCIRMLDGVHAERARKEMCIRDSFKYHTGSSEPSSYDGMLYRDKREHYKESDRRGYLCVEL